MGKIKIGEISMKKIFMFMTILFSMALLLMACSGGSKQSGSHDQTESQPEQKSVENEESASEGAETKDSFESVNIDEATSNVQSESKEDNLSAYPSEKIEYARVWLQVVGNKEVEELNVRHISAVEQLNPYDDDSVDYPEDVIVLSGKIMADGIVTYSGNGDGTINVYNVPSHWPSSEQIDQSMEDYTKRIIENTEQVSVGTGEDEEIIKLIDKLNE